MEQNLERTSSVSTSSTTDHPLMKTLVRLREAHRFLLRTSRPYRVRAQSAQHSKQGTLLSQGEQHLQYEVHDSNTCTPLRYLHIITAWRDRVLILDFGDETWLKYRQRHCSVGRPPPRSWSNASCRRLLGSSGSQATTIRVAVASYIPRSKLRRESKGQVDLASIDQNDAGDPRN